jgi:hypothetical protein
MSLNIGRVENISGKRVLDRNWMDNFLSRSKFYTMRFIFVKTIEAKFELVRWNDWLT